MDYETVQSTWKWQDADWDKFQALLKSADLNMPHIIYQKDCDQILLLQANMSSYETIHSQKPDQDNR